MKIGMDVFWAITIIVFPALVILVYQRIKVLKWLNPVMLCYGSGIILANQKILPVSLTVTKTFYEVSIPLAIILILLTLNISRWVKTAKTGLLSFGLCMVSASISSIIAAIIYKNQIPGSWKLAGMTVGVYTGGTPNMSAIGLALKVESEAFVLLNAADVVLGAFYLMILLTVAHPLMKMFLPAYRAAEKKVKSEIQAEKPQISLTKKFMFVSVNLLLAAVIFAFGVGASLVFLNEISSVLIIFMITTLSIVLSFLKRIRSLPLTFETSEYLLLMFCFAIGTSVNFAHLLQSSSMLFLFCTTVMVGAILLHFLLSFIFRIDADTFLITSVAGIYGPVFVPPVAEVMKNKEVVVTGITAGIIGYAVANYLGIGLAYLLNMFL